MSAIRAAASIAAALWIACAAGAVTGVPAQAEPLQIRAGYANTPNTMTPLLFELKDLGVLKHYGQSYTVSSLHFGGTGAEITALAAGDLDIATLAFSSLGAAIQNGHMDDLRVVADGFQDGRPNSYSAEFRVLKDSPIKSVEDLKGKVLVSNGIGGAIDMAIRAMLRRHHLEDKRDYTIVEAPFPTMKALLFEHKADLVGMVPPFSYDAQIKADTRVLFRMRDALGPTQMIVWTARKGFLEKNRAALYDFFEDSVRALHWYLDPKNRDAAIEIVARYTKQPPEHYASWIFTAGDFYHDVNARPNLAALQRNIETQRALGFLKDDIDVRKFSDLSFIDEAARRIK